MACFHGIEFNMYVHRNYDIIYTTSTTLLRQTFYRDTREIIKTEVISLLEFEIWLGNRMKQLFNPINSNHYTTLTTCEETSCLVP